MNQSISSTDSSLRKTQIDAVAEAKHRTDYDYIDAIDEQPMKLPYHQQILITEATRQSSVVGAAGPCSIRGQNSNIQNLFSPSFCNLTSSHVTVGSRVMQEPGLRQSTQHFEEPSQALASRFALPQNLQSQPFRDITHH